MIDDELRVLVSVDPPSGLDVRVRARVAADAAVAPRHSVRHLALAAAAVLIIVIGTVLGSKRASDSRPADVTVLASRAMPSDVWPSLPQTARPARPAPPALSALSARPAPGTLAAVQMDQREVRALRRLFAFASVAPLAVPEPRTGPIVVPEIAIEPIAASNTEGAHQ
jgi:hypothetical protein